MNNTRFFAFLASVMLFCSVCLTFSGASVSASAAYYKTIPVQETESGVLTLGNGEKWYRVTCFEDNADYILTVKNAAGEQQILAVTDDDITQYIWNYYRYSMTESTARRTATLSTARYALAGSGSRLNPYYSGDESGDVTWSHDDAALCFHCSGTVTYLKYNENSTEPFSMTADKADASEVIVYSRSNTLARCIVRQPAAESYVTEGSGYPAPEFSVGLADVTADSIRWFADGREQPCTSQTFTADVLRDQPAGVHRVSCIVEAHDSVGTHYREQSAEAAFVIAKGVLPDSILTFSDVHEEYSLIREAIGTVIQRTDGYIPALVICTGDLVNGPTMEKERELSRYFQQLTPNLGGLDAVFVAGNHDSSEAAAVMSAAAGLGADRNLPAKGGIIFDGESEAVASNGKNSRYAKGILTYGINYGAVVREKDGRVLYTYQDVIGDVNRFLKETAASYHGELVVISTHSGVHVVGSQDDAAIQPYEWLGANMYNVDLSNELAKTINRYAEQYDMNILYLFGHDHSRGEREMFLTEGDSVKSPQCYADLSSEKLTLHFTYAHAGYLSSVIGCASRNFAFIYRDGEQFSYDLLNVNGSLVRHAAFREKRPYEAPAVTTAAVSTAPAAGTTTSAKKAAAPDTGDRMQVMLLAVPAAAALLLSRKRRCRQ